jgi:hypothetical protein
MTIIQLQLNLWDQLAQAQRSPQDANWHQLCLAFDTAMLTLQESDQTPVGLRLATAADAIVEMAEVLAARADEFFSAWRRVPEDGPILDEDLFAEFVRQSFHLELDGLVGVPELYVRNALGKVHGDGESVVEEVSKEELLESLEPESQLEPMPLLELEHDEDVGAWAAIVREWMMSRRVQCGSISEVVNATNLPTVKVWIAALLSNFELDRISKKEIDFYDVEQLIIRTETFARCEVA